MLEPDKVILNAIEEANKEADNKEKKEIFFDFDIWLRECKEEVIEPLEGTKTGEIPGWLSGTLIRNGPGKLTFGTSSFQHLFDGSALLHRFEIKGGKSTYQCRFLPSKAFKMNQANQRIVLTEFGTRAVPDPCQTIFQRFSSMFHSPEASDNCVVSIYPMGDEMYAYSEYPSIHRIDPVTLDSLSSVNVFSKLNIVHHTSHPHVMQDGMVYNIGLCVESKPKYSIIAFPKTKKGEKKEGEDTFTDASIVARVPARWPFHPGYMHSFGITDSYYLIIDQPFCISVPILWTLNITKNPPTSMLKWFEKENTLIYVVSRETGELVRTFHCETFFYFHTINQYEEDGHVIFDLCVYKDASVVDALYMAAIGAAKDNPVCEKFRTRPVRFVLPMGGSESENLVTLPNTQAKCWTANGQFWAKPELLSDITVEMPRVNYPQYVGKKYRYFYGIGMGMDEKQTGAVIKIDTVEKTKKVWSEPSTYASEPVFVPSPNSKDEDDGIVLVSLLFSGQKRVALLVLDAKTLEELGRTVFDTPSDIPFSFHGWFADEAWPLQN